MVFNNAIHECVIVELIFRVFALVTAAAQNTNEEINYKPSMSSFINNFCFSAKKFDDNID